ncbi:FAD-dependent monooxygenase [Mycobacterium sp. 1164985.4]|uniref:FAD-dependent monooxygenase n=1 Tax=Mycobacterium sp. 1164985.4 TaxID=1834069 RepID=UPI0007FBD3D0|nr:FAD-dependent monooxygenase [Mycobacterium sp. 1164985.4]OBK75775.1 FAD-dependent oxidoreductase [Mycobacterium sp. 1164985.4]
MTVDSVVISGAGPNGLLLACELALAGVRPVVLDRLPGPSDEPKANGLVGQAIRQLDMRGLYHAFGGDEGPPRPAGGWPFAGMALNFLDIEPNPMHALLIPQPRLVRLLEKHARGLGVDIRWGHELVDLEPGTESVAVTVAGDGRPYELRTRYLVGADGGRSFVRKRAGIGFPGHTSPIESRVAHVGLPDEFLVPGQGYDIPGFGRLRFGYNRFERGSIILFPLEPDRPLLGTIEYGRASQSADDMTLDELRASVRRLIGVDVPLDTPKSAGPHALRRLENINSRQADRYRAGRVLLLGDAAHVHSPMGGPGLNLGLADAVNLGWKLAAVVSGWHVDDLLDTYESERYPVGERVMMHSQAQLALSAPGPDVEALRTLFGELSQQRGVSQHLADLLAGSDVRYEVGDDHPLSGRMAPELTLTDGRRLAELLHRGHAVLLDLDGGVAAAVGEPWVKRVDPITASAQERPAAAMLVRPDGYVAWAAERFDDAGADALRIALTRWFGYPLPNVSQGWSRNRPTLRPAKRGCTP